MKGGFYNPPNATYSGPGETVRLASMKGGFYNPPNASRGRWSGSGGGCFNEGGVL